MAVRGFKRSRSRSKSRPRKVFRKSLRTKRRPLRKSTGKRTFAKRVKTSLYKLTESKKIVCYIPTTAGGTPFAMMNLKGKNITILSVNPIVSYNTAYNMLERRLGPLPASTPYIATVGGDPSTVIGTTGRLYGDSINGNEMMPTSLRVRAEFRSTIFAPPSKTMIMCIMGNVGDTPTAATIWKNQLNNSFLDDFNYPRFKLIGRYQFSLGGVSIAGNNLADLHKPGGTGVDNSTGTYWNVEGVTAVDDAQEATMTENTVKFSGASTMQTLAPKVHIMDWKISLAKVGKVTYNGGTYVDGNIHPERTTKEKAMWLVAYNYANNIQGANPQLPNVIIDELRWDLHFKDL